MKIDILSSSGFCGGVIRALHLLDKTIKENSDKDICLLGPIVHNNIVNKKYMDLGVKFISEMDLGRIDKEKSIVLISAHGVSERMHNILKDFNVVDTTCPYVQKNINLVNENNALDVIFIGKKNHSETKAICEGKNNIKIVENEKDLYSFDSLNIGKVFNQTTINQFKLKKIHEMIERQAPYYEIVDTTCIVSKENQSFLESKNPDYTTCIIVGDRTSNNANSLYEMSPYENTFFISSEKEASSIKLRDFDSVIIIGSASTPKTELKKIKDALKAANNKNSE